jgi:AcrR family transcriptional regulator
MDQSQPTTSRAGRRADAERNRAALLAAARAAFATEGESARLEHIAQAGVGIGTLYRNFPNRESLVEAVYRSELNDLCASAHELLTQLPPETALRAWMDRFGGYVAVKREIASALAPASASGAVSVSRARTELAEAITEILRAGAADGSLRSEVRAEDHASTATPHSSPGSSTYSWPPHARSTTPARNTACWRVAAHASRTEANPANDTKSHSSASARSSPPRLPLGRRGSPERDTAAFASRRQQRERC